MREFARLLDGSWVRASQGLSQLRIDGTLETFVSSWPRSGMTRGLTVYLRPPSAKIPARINEFLPTPRAADSGSGQWASAETAEKSGYQPMLSSWVLMEELLRRRKNKKRRGKVASGRLFPTPSVYYSNVETMERARFSGDERKKWPIPRAADGTTGKSSEQAVREGRSNNMLGTAVGGTLNPAWVEWIMGFPLGWTKA